jgi:hypothetical protein
MTGFAVRFDATPVAAASHANFLIGCDAERS